MGYNIVADIIGLSTFV